MRFCRAFLSYSWQFSITQFLDVRVANNFERTVNKLKSLFFILKRPVKNSFQKNLIKSFYKLFFSASMNSTFSSFKSGNYTLSVDVRRNTDVRETH